MIFSEPETTTTIREYEGLGKFRKNIYKSLIQKSFKNVVGNIYDDMIQYIHRIYFSGKIHNFNTRVWAKW